MSWSRLKRTQEPDKPRTLHGLAVGSSREWVRKERRKKTRVREPKRGRSFRLRILIQQLSPATFLLLLSLSLFFSSLRLSLFAFPYPGFSSFPVHVVSPFFFSPSRECQRGWARVTETCQGGEPRAVYRTITITRATKRSYFSLKMHIFSSSLFLCSSNILILSTRSFFPSPHCLFSSFSRFV